MTFCVPSPYVENPNFVTVDAPKPTAPKRITASRAGNGCACEEHTPPVKLRAHTLITS